MARDDSAAGTPKQLPAMKRPAMKKPAARPTPKDASAKGTKRRMAEDKAKRERKR